MICWSLTLAWAEAGYNSHTLVNNIYSSTSGNRNFADEDENDGAFVTYGGGGGPPSEPNEENDRIIGGTKAEGDQFGFMAFVYFNQDDLSDVMAKSCSATVIGRQWLLTAAHCLTAHDGTKVIHSKWIPISLIC